MAPGHGLSRVLADLRARGVLLESDAKFPSVAGIVTGAPQRGSWWKHPRAHEIFEVSRALADHRDVVVTKLIANKVSYVHRKLWPALVAIGTSRGAWQRECLSEAAADLLRYANRRGTVRSDDYASTLSAGARIGDLVRELERRLLVVTEEIHTERGAHAKVLWSWGRWRRREGVVADPAGAREAKKRFEGLHEGFGRPGVLPWN